MRYAPERMSPAKRLLETMDLIVALLRRYGETHWSEWVEGDAQRIRRGDMAGVKHFLSAFGGMGSFLDVYLCQQNNSQIRPEEVTPVNAELLRLQGEAYEQATALQREMAI